MKFKSIIEVENYYKENQKSYELVYSLLEDSINNKITAIEENKIEECKETLIELNFIEQKDGAFHLNLNSLGVLYLLLKYSEKILNRTLPTNVEDAIIFVKEFLKTVENNFVWSEKIGLKLELFIWVYLIDKSKIDIVNYYFDKLTKPEENRRVLFSFVHYIEKILNYYDLEFAGLEKLYLDFLGSNDKGHILNEYPRTLVKNKREYAIGFYNYLKENKSYQIRSRYLAELYQEEPEKYLKEAFSLIRESETDGIWTLCSINYLNLEDMIKAFDEIARVQVGRIESIRILPIFYTQLLRNANCTLEMSQRSFMCLHQLATLEIDDKGFRNQLVFRVKMINGFDQEKYALFCLFVEWGFREIVPNYFDYFESPKHFFKVMKDFFSQVGVNVDFSLFEGSLSIIQSKNEEEFETLLLEFLGNDIPSVRFAGIRILISNPLRGRKYDLLKLDKGKQILILDSLLYYPMSIELIFPFLLQLRNSKFKNVRVKLKKEISDLFQAYESHILELLEKSLDRKIDKDAKLIKEFGKVYDDYKKKRDEKKKYSELNPFKNDREFLDKYYQTEMEYNRKLMEKAQENSFMKHLGKSIGTIRGSGFKLEGEEKPNMMGTHSTKIRLDRRTFIDPEKHTWNIYNYFKKETE